MRIDYPEIRANLLKPQVIVDGRTACRCSHPVEVSPVTTVYQVDEHGRLDFNRPVYAHVGCLTARDAELRRRHGMDAKRPAGTPRPGAARLHHRKTPEVLGGEAPTT